jgi:hypothetical protein
VKLNTLTSYFISLPDEDSVSEGQRKKTNAVVSLANQNTVKAPSVNGPSEKWSDIDSDDCEMENNVEMKLQ